MNVQSILNQMTLEEKAALCTGANGWATTPIDRLDLPAMIVSDGPHGVRRIENLEELATESHPATCFPTASCLASTWNVDLIHELGEALAEECIALSVDTILGPGVNIKRSPLGGRNFEHFSEDPFLAGEIAVSFINAIQNKGIGTSLKHFAANNQEFQRFTISAEIDERTLREIYLPAFEKAIKEAQPWTVMCAYNKINGTYGSQHDELLNKILRDEWGFEGIVVSDWGAVRDRVAALKAGLDWQMPGPHDRDVQRVINAVKSGELDEAVLDQSAGRILATVAKAQATPKIGDFDAEAHHQLAKEIATEGMVLLKNNGILPLGSHDTIAVIGRSAEHAHFQGAGSSHINPTQVAVPFNELKLLAKDVEFIYAEGYPSDDSIQQSMIDEAVSQASSANVALLYIALPGYKESEGYDRTDLDLTRQQLALIQAVSAVQPNTVVILNNGAPIVMGDWIDNVAAVLEGWMMGQAGGSAIADILFGHANPSGRLSETFPAKLTDTPSYLNWPGEAGKVNYGEGLFIGYRYYDTKQIPPAFPFGYGLSYTNFEYNNPTVSATRFKDCDGVTVTVDVTNTGDMAGKETVQLYVHDQKASLVRPNKELKGFAKVALEPGETKTVSINLDFRAFAFFHPSYGEWITEDGDMDLLIGASSDDIHHTITVALESTVELPCILTKESTVQEWFDDPRGNEIFSTIFDQVADDLRAGTDGMGMDVLDMFRDMPVVSVLLNLANQLEQHPEDIVAEMLAQVHG